MAVALVASSKASTVWTGTVASPQTVSPGVASTVGNKLLVWAFIGRTAPGTVTVTDNSTQAGATNTYVKVGSSVTNTNISVTFFYCDCTRSVLATDALSVAWTGGTASSQLNVSEWSGAASGAVANSVSATGNSAAPATGALTTSVAGDLVLGGFGLGATLAYTAGQDGQGNTMTSLHAPTSANFRSSGAEYLVESGTLAYNPAGPAWSGANWVALGVRIGAAGAGGAPVNSVAPAVTGTLRNGSTLTTSTGTWSGSPSFAYQWKRGATNVGTNASTYVLVSADVGQTVTVVVTGTNGSGSATATSNAVGLIGGQFNEAALDITLQVCGNDTQDVYSPGPVSSGPVNSVLPVVSGTATVGQVLTTTDGTWTNSPTSISYQWQRDTQGVAPFVNIAGAVNPTHTNNNADDGCRIDCVVTATNAAASTPATSNIVGPVVQPAPVNTTLPVVSGEFTVGRPLVTTDGAWNNMLGLVATFGYQWRRDNSGGLTFVDIAGAVDNFYFQADNDAGCNLECVVTATNTGGATAATSTPVGPVIPFFVAAGHYGPQSAKEPVARTERRAAGVGPDTNIIGANDAAGVWGPRLATDPEDRQLDKARGGTATSITAPEDAAVALWRLENSVTP